MKKLFSFFVLLIITFAGIFLYFFLKSTSEPPGEPLSKNNVYFSNNIKGEITLHSLDQRVEKSGDVPSCLMPKKGMEIITGHFSLRFKGQGMGLGEMSFVKNTPYDGTLNIMKLDPESDQDFIIIYQYGSCNFNLTRIYGYDLKTNYLIQYSFLKKNNEKIDEVNGMVEQLSSSKEFTTQYYDNGSGTNKVSKWKFNNKNGAFEEVQSWEGKGS